MKIEKISGKTERRILIGMITDDAVCARIAGKWSPDLFRSRWANVVGGFCAKYAAQYGTAPRKAIEPLYEAWASKHQRDPDTVALVEKFLGGLSDEYERANGDTNGAHLVDTAARHFTRVRLARTVEQVQGELDAGEVEKAVERVAAFNQVEMGTGASVSVLHDREALERAFAERAEPLITLPDGLGKFFGRALQREGFIAFLGPEKRGKTTWLVYLAWQAMLQRRKVAFFSVGDESEEEMMLRFGTLAARHPLHPETVKVPVSVGRSGGKATAKFEERTFDRALTAKMVRRAFRKVKELRVRSDRDFLRLVVHPNSTLTVAGIDAQLQEWEREGWVPDVVVTDYMDILDESGNQRDDIRHRINATWKAMRGLAQKWHVLAASATQANAASYGDEIITRKNFSEDKRKLAHVTGMVGLNQDDTEKEAGTMRLNWVVGRSFGYSTGRCCYCAGAQAIGNPAVKSRF